MENYFLFILKFLINSNSHSTISFIIGFIWNPFIFKTFCTKIQKQSKLLFTYMQVIDQLALELSSNFDKSLKLDPYFTVTQEIIIEIMF